MHVFGVILMAVLSVAHTSGQQNRSKAEDMRFEVTTETSEHRNYAQVEHGQPTKNTIPARAD